MSGLRETRTDVERFGAELNADHAQFMAELRVSAETGMAPKHRNERLLRWGEQRAAAHDRFLFELPIVQRFDNWTDEQAAMLLAGFPIGLREQISEPAHAASLARVHAILAVIDSGSTERRPPSAWIEWADVKQIDVPEELRRAIQPAPEDPDAKLGQATRRQNSEFGSRSAQARELTDWAPLVADRDSLAVKLGKAEASRRVAAKHPGINPDTLRKK